MKFPIAAITNDYKLDGLKQFWGLEGLKRSQQGWFLLEAVRENLFLGSLLALGGFCALLGL